MAFSPRGPLYGPQVKLNSSDAQRQQFMAQMLLKEGIDLSPVKSNWEALARVGTAGIGGYLQNQAGETEKEYQSDRAKTLAQALLAGQDQPAPAAPTLAGGEAAATRGTGVAQQGTKGDPMKVAQMLMANPSTADMGAQLALGQMQFAQQRGAQKEDTAASQAFQREMTGIQQQFQTGQLTAQQAFAAQQAAQQRAHAAGLQTNAQQFQSGQTTAQQAFQAAENAKSREQQMQVAQINRVPAGFTAEGGKMAPVPGGPADPAYLGQKTEATAGAKMTDEQAKAAGFADRISNALPVIAATTGAGTDIKQSALSKLPIVGNFAVSDEYQKFDQAQRDIINAILRRESGAVIAESEFDNARKQYFPQPGDSAAVLQQKEKNLQEALQGMQRSAGSAYKKQESPKTNGIKFLGFE